MAELQLPKLATRVRFPSPAPSVDLPEWRNGSRSRLKICRTRVREGSSPSSGTTADVLAGQLALSDYEQNICLAVDVWKCVCRWNRCEVEIFAFTLLCSFVSCGTIYALTPKGSTVRDTVRRPRRGVGCVRRRAKSACSAGKVPQALSISGCSLLGVGLTGHSIPSRLFGAAQATAQSRPAMSESWKGRNQGKRNTNEKRKKRCNSREYASACRHTTIVCWTRPSVESSTRPAGLVRRWWARSRCRPASSVSR